MKEGDSSILIVGTGAMACLFAARLAAAGVNVTMLGSWKAGLRALEQDGVRLLEPSGSEIAYPVRAVSSKEACIPARYALVLVKSWGTAKAARQLSHCLSPEGLALTLQNGLGNREALSAALGPERVALGVTTIGATLLGPGRVRPAGEGKLMLNGHPRLGPVEAMLREAGFPIERVEDPGALLWGKLVINAAINPLTAILEVPNGELLRRAEARELMGALALEAAAVAHAQGVCLPFDDPVRAAEDVALRTAPNCSSMLQDVRRGACTEIDAICGAIVREGAKHNVATPTNQVLWKLVKTIENSENREN